MEIYEMSLGELDSGLRAGAFSLNEVLESLVNRIEAREKITQAFIELDLDRVRSQINQINPQDLSLIHISEPTRRS